MYNCCWLFGLWNRLLIVLHLHTTLPFDEEKKNAQTQTQTHAHAQLLFGQQQQSPIHVWTWYENVDYSRPIFSCTVKNVVKHTHDYTCTGHILLNVGFERLFCTRSLDTNIWAQTMEKTNTLYIGIDAIAQNRDKYTHSPRTLYGLWMKREMRWKEWLDWYMLEHISQVT